MEYCIEYRMVYHIEYHIEYFTEYLTEYLIEYHTVHSLGQTKLKQILASEQRLKFRL